MVILPYVGELVIYALILALLRDAERGEFSGFRKFLRRCAASPERGADENRDVLQADQVGAVRAPRQAPGYRRDHGDVSASDSEFLVPAVVEKCPDRKVSST